MSKLFSCFRQKKKTEDYGVQAADNRRSERLSRDSDGVVYLRPGDYIDDGSYRKFGSNVRQVYRTETEPQYRTMYVSDENANRQSRSYPVSPERRPVYKAHSFEQRLSFEKQRFVSKKDSRDSRNLQVYAANVSPIKLRLGKTDGNSIDSLPFDTPVSVPRRSILSHGVDYEKETMVPKESPICIAEKPGEELHKPGTSRDKPESPTVTNDKNTSVGERLSVLRSKVTSESFSPRSSIMESQNVPYIAVDNANEPQIKTLVRMVPQRSSRKFSLGSNVKPMVYRVDDRERSPLSAYRHVHQIPIKVKRQNQLLTTEDGRILRPLSSENQSVTKGNQPIRLSVIKPAGPVENFPLAQGREAIVAAPMIGSGGRVRKGGKQQKSILRKGRGRAPVNDYDDYGYEGSYYDDEADMYSQYDPYSYDGYGYQDEYMGRYGQVMPRGGRQARQQIYAAKMPEITLPVPDDKGKNPPFKKTSKPSTALDSCIDKDYYDMKNEKSENREQLSKDHKVKLVSSAQQTDIKNELDFICFSPDKCFNTLDIPDDPNSKLRWRIIIKRGDEE